jgi:hypothetical protein
MTPLTYSDLKSLVNNGDITIDFNEELYNCFPEKTISEIDSGLKDYTFDGEFVKLFAQVGTVSKFALLAQFITTPYIFSRLFNINTFKNKFLNKLIYILNTLIFKRYETFIKGKVYSLNTSLKIKINKRIKLIMCIEFREDFKNKNDLNILNSLTIGTDGSEIGSVQVFAKKTVHIDNFADIFRVTLYRI